jgi:transposase-like protein
MTLANEEKLLRRWVEQQRPFGRGHSYTPTLRRRIVKFVELAKAAGMTERDCCKAIGISRQSLSVWRRAEQPTPAHVEDHPELSVERCRKRSFPSR